MTFVAVANLNDLEVGDYDLTTGEAVGPYACGPAPLYACKIEDDAIWVDIDQQLNDASIPRPPLI